MLDSTLARWYHIVVREKGRLVGAVEVVCLPTYICSQMIIGTIAKLLGPPAT